MAKSKIKKPLIVTLIVVILVAFIAMLPIIVMFSANMFAWSAIFLGGWLSPNPPMPEITYAEFPFEIVYEIDGKTITLNDIYICEFDGIDWNEGNGKHREWKGYIKSTGAEDLILLEDGNLKLACSLGGPWYYMSDPSMPSEEHTPFIYYMRTNENGGTGVGVLDIEPILEQNKIKLISWKLSKPIQNSFK